MKSFVFLLLIATIVCISVIHSAPVSLTRNNHRVDEPLGFLTNFILNKRTRVVQNSAVASVGVEGKKRAVESRPSTSPRYRNTYWKVSTGSLKGNSIPSNQKSLVEDGANNEDAAKSSPVTQLSFSDLANRNERTVEATPAEVNLAEVLPVEIVEVPVVEVVEIVPVQVVDAVVVPEIAASASVEASSASTDESTVSVAAVAISETGEKESSVKAIEVPSVATPNKVVYVNKNPDFRVTLQVIKVEIDPVDPEPTLDTVSKDSAPIESAPVAEVSVGASTSSTNEFSSVSAVAEAVAVVPGDAITPTEAAVTNPVEEAHDVVFGIPVVAVPVSSLSFDSASAPYSPEIAPEILVTESYNGGTETDGLEGVEGSGGEPEGSKGRKGNGAGGGSESSED